MPRKTKMTDGGVSFGAPGVNRALTSFEAQVRVYAEDERHGLICHTFPMGRYANQRLALSMAKMIAGYVDNEPNATTEYKLVRAKAYEIAHGWGYTLPGADDFSCARRAMQAPVARLVHKAPPDGIVSDALGRVYYRAPASAA